MRAFILVSLFFTFGTPESSEVEDYCDDLRVCLERLESKQRECLKLPVLEKEDFLAKSSATEECKRKERRKLQRQLNGLQLRRTEVLEDCVAARMHHSETVLNPVQERKCESASQKLQIFNEFIINSKGGKALKSKKKSAIKQSHKVCRRVKKMLSKKCHELAKCCSISNECEQKANGIFNQIVNLRRDLRFPQNVSSCD